ncbi:hypothetical protein [Photobacterium leiognathi]|uniref:hypothetical protein n=1 Tax=Photobacterium leiognathi TaxID=553611 RepID=UPI002980C4A4|nr:hypothetical protein [Photobacterium leiognathi]
MKQNVADLLVKLGQVNFNLSEDETPTAIKDGYRGRGRESSVPAIEADSLQTLVGLVADWLDESNIDLAKEALEELADCSSESFGRDNKVFY